MTQQKEMKKKKQTKNNKYTWRMGVTCAEGKGASQQRGRGRGGRGRWERGCHDGGRRWKWGRRSGTEKREEKKKWKEEEK